MTIQYEMARQWILFDMAGVQVELLGAKAAMLALTQIPYQRGGAPANPAQAGGGWDIAD